MLRQIRSHPKGSSLRRSFLRQIQVKMIKNISAWLSCGALWGAAWFSNAAWAVNDLPGGPAVHQFNLQPAATKIAEEQGWLHWFMLIKIGRAHV